VVHGGYQPSGWHGYIVKPMILQRHRQVCKGGGAETLLSVNMQMFGYSPPQNTMYTNIMR